ncbi:MAG: hypothetical protein Q8Q33_03170 [Chlamydiota bacterium]|nr:hypothetical protein [Chlamydiota bacterium]
MAQWKSGFRNKKIFRLKERIQRALIRRTKKTKASIRRDFRKNYQLALDHLLKYNKTSDLREKTRHICVSLDALEKLIQDRPGNHLLREQHALCREEYLIQSQLETADRNRTVVIRLDTDFQP